MSNPFVVESVKIFNDQIEVFPMAITDLPKLKPIANRIGTLAMSVAGDKDFKSLDRQKAAGELLKLIKGDGDKFIIDLYDLVASAVEPKFPARTPYYVLVDATRAWFKLSFESEHARPTVALVESIFQSMTGDPTLKFSTIRSMFSSMLDTVSKKSSTSEGETAPTVDGLIASSIENSNQPIVPTGANSANQQ